MHATAAGTRTPARLIAAAAILTATAATCAAQNCPVSPPVTVTSPAVPSDVCIPVPPPPGVPFPYFDDFSWRSFIAMVWPALAGQRGAPDTTQTVGGKGPRVFETYKMLHEVFHTDGSAPTAWNSYDPANMNPCNVAMAFGDLTLASFSKFANLGQAGVGKLVGPLVAQNTTYVRFETAFNPTEFNQITGAKWYLRANLPATLTFQNGAIDIKSAWIDMTNMPNPGRYYTRSAWLLDPGTGVCAQKTVGLVGLHIVQKTPSRPQWIWSTFEQIDNVPPAAPGAPGAFGFNNGKGQPMPPVHPYSLDPLPSPTPAPFNVTRTLPVATSTQQTNAAYQAALAGTPWQFYQLTMTQWPVTPNNPSLPGTPNNTFPGLGATTAFANTTLETFDQGNIKSGCMNCHNFTKAATDFLWSLNDHAFPSSTPNLLIANKGLNALVNQLVKQPNTAAATDKKTIELMNKKLKQPAAPQPTK